MKKTELLHKIRRLSLISIDSLTTVAFDPLKFK
jgi:hypothetical protein